MLEKKDDFIFKSLSNDNNREVNLLIDNKEKIDVSLEIENSENNSLNSEDIEIGIF